MKTFLGLLGALVVGFSVGMLAAHHCPVFKCLTCPVAKHKCCPTKGKCCCECCGDKCKCCDGCVAGKDCVCTHCHCCMSCKGHKVDANAQKQGCKDGCCPKK